MDCPFRRVIILLGILSCLLPLQAQRRNILVYQDPQTGKDSIISQPSFVPVSSRKAQYEVSIMKDGNIIERFTPLQVHLYRQGSKTYYSKTIEINGEKKQVMLQRVLKTEHDSLSIYRFINDRKFPVYYYQFGNEPEVYPMAESADSKTGQPLKDYLLSFPVAQKDKYVQDYINKMQPTLQSYKNRARICLNDNINFLPAFRWGIMTGMGGSRLSTDIEIHSKQQWQWQVGAFADIPLMQFGFSLHPELTFLKFSASSYTQFWNAAYNRTTLQVPLLLRYTLVAIRGKILPYVQVGPELGFRVKGNTEICRYTNDEEGYVTDYKIYQENNKGFYLTGTAGVGVEMKIQRRHSVFIDLRYRSDFTEDNFPLKTSGWFMTASYNL